MSTLPSNLLSAWRKYAVYGLPVLIVLLVPRIIPGYFATPVVFEGCGKPERHTIFLNGESRAQLTHIQQRNEPCAYTVQLAGTGFAPEPGMVLRAFNMDGHGKVFLHEPPLALVDGTWSTANIRPGDNIRSIRLMRVPAAISETYSAGASHQIWGPYAVHADAQLVAIIDLAPESICTELDARKCATAPFIPAKGDKS